MNVKTVSSLVFPYLNNKEKLSLSANLQVAACAVNLLKSAAGLSRAAHQSLVMKGRVTGPGKSDTGLSDTEAVDVDHGSGMI